MVGRTRSVPATVVAAVALGVFDEVTHVLDEEALAAGIAAALAVGAVAGIYPSVRASRLAPADAVRTA